MSLEREKRHDVSRIARERTGDESTLYLNYSHTHMRPVSDDECLVPVDETIASEKYMLTALWSRKVPLVVKWFGPGDKFDTTYFCDVTIAKLVQALYPGRAVPRRRKISLHLDNSRLHNSAGATKFIDGTNSSNCPSPHIRRMSTIRLLSFWNAERKAQKLYRENA
jgi:hypothetical protein